MGRILTSKVINRLTLYHSILSEYTEGGAEFISSPQIAELLHIDDTLVRKDIALIGYKGRCRAGYKADELLLQIESALKFKTVKTAVIIGAGNLGTALAKYDSFEAYGFKITAMFDTDISKIGSKVNNKEIFQLDALQQHIEKNNTKIAVLTVPREAAQEAADFLIRSGIKYIWNFTPCVLKTPDDVSVWNENLIGNFLQFTAGEIEG